MHSSHSCKLSAVLVLACCLINSQVGLVQAVSVPSSVTCSTAAAAAAESACNSVITPHLQHVDAWAVEELLCRNGNVLLLRK
jgi:hypothetical protein